jgi:hypothetical protein
MNRIGLKPFLWPETVVSWNVMSLASASFFFMAFFDSVTGAATSAAFYILVNLHHTRNTFLASNFAVFAAFFASFSTTHVRVTKK